MGAGFGFDAGDFVLRIQALGTGVDQLMAA